ncbi:hypothetical protein HDV00_000971 [Rhizophlyctis rosea]|nr:hypothetical protein HDV00_000971 [Rhizophlyctis rosea]
MSATTSPTKPTAPASPSRRTSSEFPPPSADSTTSTFAPSINWSADLEVSFFQGIARYRPVGVHKHFRMLNVQRFFNKHTGLNVTVDQLWERLALYYNLEELDSLADESDDEITIEARRKRSAYPFKVTAEFNLPSEDFESIITEQRRADSGTDGEDEGDDATSSSEVASARKGRRDSSPGLSSEPSSPEPVEEATPKPRRPGRPRKVQNVAQQSMSEPPQRRTRSGSGAGQTLTPTPAAKKKRVGK